MKCSILLYSLWVILCSSLSFGTENQEQTPEEARRVHSSKETAIWGITEDQLDELFENSTDYVVLTDEYQFSRVNKRWTEILGWTSDELTSQPMTNFVHPEDVLSTSNAAQKGSKVDCVINFKNRYRTNKGDYHLIEWFTLLQVSGSNRKSPLLAIGKDLTLEKKSQDQKYALQQAEAASRLKSTFVAHMSHEIRTPLNGILGFLNLASEEDNSELVCSYLENAQESSQFLLNVANDIIDVSKIEAGALKIEEVNFNPFTAVKSVLSLFSLQAHKKDIALESIIAPNLPPVLKGDENRFRQILINLMGNAVKFTSQGKISLKIQGQSTEDNSPTFLVQGKVKDTGIGIEADFIPKLFQPFSQEDHSMRRQFGGAGLGLYITKQLCERMGGGIQVLSTPGKGTTFQFHVLFGQPPLRSPNLVIKPSLPVLSPSKTLVGSKILLVEDNLMNQKVITLVLKKLGCEVDIADNGQVGLEALSRKKYDLVLMDGEMPVMDGLQATKEIRKQFSSQQLPIIGLSAHAMSTHRELFLGVGMNSYLTKPVNKDALAQEITKCLNGISNNVLALPKDIK